MKGKFKVVANAHPAREKQMTLFVFQTLFRFEAALERSGQYWNDVTCGFYITLLVGLILCWSCWTSLFFTCLIKLLFVFQEHFSWLMMNRWGVSQEALCVWQSYQCNIVYLCKYFHIKNSLHPEFRNWMRTVLWPRDWLTRLRLCFVKVCWCFPFSY